MLHKCTLAACVQLSALEQVSLLWVQEKMKRQWQNHKASAPVRDMNPIEHCEVCYLVIRRQVGGKGGGCLRVGWGLKGCSRERLQSHGPMG